MSELSMSSFEARVRVIFDYIAEFGIKRMPVHTMGPLTESQKQKFKALVHFGFRLGQRKLIIEILELYRKKRTLEVRLKEVRKNKNQEEKERAARDLNANEHKIHVLRHFADFIAWQAMGGHHFRTRTFYSGKRERPDLLSTNLEAVLLTADELYLRDPNSFCLISDLTTFIDVGDILWIQYDRVNVVEVKSGPVQRKVNVLVAKMIDVNHQFTKEDFDQITPSMYKQAERTAKQIVKGSAVTSFINTEKGKDAFSDEKRTVLTSPSEQRYYFGEIERLMSNARQNKDGTGSVEDLIHILVTEPQYVPKMFNFENSSHLRIGSIFVVDYERQIYSPITDPLFLKLMVKENIFDLLFERLKVIISIDVEKLIAFFNAGGLKTELLSRKESVQFKKGNPKNRPFFLDERVISMKDEHLTLTLGDSFLIRLLFDNLMPSSLRQTYIDIFSGAQPPPADATFGKQSGPDGQE